MSVIKNEIDKFKSGDQIVWSENFMPVSREKILKVHKERVFEIEQYCDIVSQDLFYNNGYFCSKIKAIKK